MFDKDFWMRVFTMFLFILYAAYIFVVGTLILMLTFFVNLGVGLAIGTLFIFTVAAWYQLLEG